MSLTDYEPIHNTNFPPALVEAHRVTPCIHGQVRRPGMHYRVRLDWDGKRLRGRLGGAIFGEDVYLEAAAGQVLGWVARSGRVFALHAWQGEKRLELRLVTTGRGMAAQLELAEASASGYIHFEGRVQPVEMEFSPTELRARVAPDQTVTLHHPGFPDGVLAVAALAADVAARDAWRVLLESYTGWAEV